MELSLCEDENGSRLLCLSRDCKSVQLITVDIDSGEGGASRRERARREEAPRPGWIGSATARPVALSRAAIPVTEVQDAQNRSLIKEYAVLVAWADIVAAARLPDTHKVPEGLFQVRRVWLVRLLVQVDNDGASTSMRVEPGTSLPVAEDNSLFVADRDVWALLENMTLAVVGVRVDRVDTSQRRLVAWDLSPSPVDSDHAERPLYEIPGGTVSKIFLVCPLGICYSRESGALAYWSPIDDNGEFRAPPATPTLTPSPFEIGDEVIAGYPTSPLAEEALAIEECVAVLEPGSMQSWIFVVVRERNDEDGQEQPVTELRWLYFSSGQPGVVLGVEQAGQRESRGNYVQLGVITPKVSSDAPELRRIAILRYGARSSMIDLNSLTLADTESKIGSDRVISCELSGTGLVCFGSSVAYWVPDKGLDAYVDRLFDDVPNSLAPQQFRIKNRAIRELLQAKIEQLVLNRQSRLSDQRTEARWVEETSQGVLQTLGSSLLGLGPDLGRHLEVNIVCSHRGLRGSATHVQGLLKNRTACSFLVWTICALRADGAEIHSTCSLGVASTSDILKCPTLTAHSTLPFMLIIEEPCYDSCQLTVQYSLETQQAHSPVTVALASCDTSAFAARFCECESAQAHDFFQQHCGCRVERSIEVTANAGTVGLLRQECLGVLVSNFNMTAVRKDLDAGEVVFQRDQLECRCVFLDVSLQLFLGAPGTCEDQVDEIIEYFARTVGESNYSAAAIPCPDQRWHDETARATESLLRALESEIESPTPAAQNKSDRSCLAVHSQVLS